MQQRKLTSNLWRKNRITLQWQKNIAYYLWRKKITLCKSKLNYDLLLTQVPKNECYNVYLGIRKKHNWIVYVCFNHTTELEHCWIDWSWLCPPTAVMFFSISSSDVVFMIGGASRRVGICIAPWDEHIMGWERGGHIMGWGRRAGWPSPHILVPTLSQ